MTTNAWLNSHHKRRAAMLRAEWADEMGHDREWWLREARRTRTDWSPLLRQRLRVLWWLRLGRPSWREFLRMTGW